MTKKIRNINMRTAQIERKTNETVIKVSLNLDGSGKHAIHTGIGFLDHMLTHLAVHGLFDLELNAQGDLGIDAHHTVEDCALGLGQALDQALADRRGIVRMGSAYVPMDEALAFVAVDLSGRPYWVMDVTWYTPAVGGIDTSLMTHFFESLAASARINLHARVLYGRDDHHQAEALFKALGRALEAAVRLDPRRGLSIPSTKGRLT
jgi:imidazoleglycerol-phosphate dehydratase